jgi:hypothetical protein
MATTRELLEAREQETIREPEAAWDNVDDKLMHLLATWGLGPQPKKSRKQSSIGDERRLARTNSNLTARSGPSFQKSEDKQDDLRFRVGAGVAQEETWQQGDSLNPLTSRRVNEWRAQVPPELPPSRLNPLAKSWTETDSDGGVPLRTQDKLHDE